MFKEFIVVLMALLIEGNVGQNLSWWQTSIVYQVYPRSFKDSDGDGIGDLKGIISKLDYFNNIGVDSIWISPIYKSPMKDFGYDISNYTDIDPIFGTLADFDALVSEANKKGVNVIMDFVPGHTSSDHPWFMQSVNNVTKYIDYYIWNDGKMADNGTRLPPNNWLSVFGGSAWSLHPVRNQWYYHAFLDSQPDLNYRNQDVQEEMKNVLRFWLNRGVKGFRIDAIEKLYESVNVTQDEPLSRSDLSPFQYEYLNHTLTSNQPETIQTVTDWVKVIEENQGTNTRYCIIELYGPPSLRNTLYPTGCNPFNFDLIDFPPNKTALYLRDLIAKEYDTLPSGKWPNFVLGNHDRRRVSYKFGSQYVDVFNMLLLTLWGTPTTYYGEEIGMLEGIISWNQTIDPWGRNYGEALYQNFSRDPERTPMQWTNGSQAGFTTGSMTWLPLGQNYTTYNVETENNTMGISTLKLYAKLANLRKQKIAFQQSAPKIAFVNENVYSFSREGGGEKYLVALNIGKMKETVNFTSYFDNGSTATVTAYTPGSEATFKSGTADLNSINLQPGDGVVLQINAPATITTAKPGSAHGLRSAFLAGCILPLFVSIFTWIRLAT